jgi:hypothetical protein
VDDHAAVAAADVVDHVVLGHFAELAHLGHDVVRRGHEADLDVLGVVGLGEIDDDLALGVHGHFAGAGELGVVVGLPNAGDHVVVALLGRLRHGDAAFRALAFDLLAVHEHNGVFLGHEHLEDQALLFADARRRHRDDDADEQRPCQLPVHNASAASQVIGNATLTTYETPAACDSRVTFRPGAPGGMMTVQ